jgi:hypothetical protein
LLRLARALREQGTAPVGIRDPSIYHVRAASQVVPDNVNWVEWVKDKVTVRKAAA